MNDSRNPQAIDAKTYCAKARQLARQALGELRWLDWPTPIEPAKFEELFPTLRGKLRDLQSAAVDLAETLTTPGIVIVESPMGEGKTEAAIFLADHWNAVLGQRGCYFALPTQATSNQMFGRVRDYLARRYADSRVLLQLLHGHAALSAEFESLLKEGAKPNQSLQLDGVHGEDVNQGDCCAASVAAAEWFTYRKRGLLAPFGVGTVDQALMAALQTKHVFVRLFGLSHKTIIIDEVHAYDAHMLQTSTQNSRSLKLRLVDGDIFKLAERLQDALKNGGCATVICNTVRRAQDVYEALKPFFPGKADDDLPALDLLHARYLFKDRAEREVRTLMRFGKPGDDVRRPNRAVLVSTQIIEQSLDLDFDLMITELAPVDLMLQRAGRLHRHRKPDLPAARFLLERSVSINNFGAVESLLDKDRDDPTPSVWREAPLLRHHKLIVVDGESQQQIKDHLFRVHPELGIVVTKLSPEEA